MAEMPPAVSVIVTVYNEEPRFLAEAIGSVKAQTVRPAEIIIVEDGALRDYAEVYRFHPDLKVIRQVNQGLAAARNTGLHAASGEFILFLDGDDLMSPHSLAINLERLAAAPDAAMSYGAYRTVDSEGCEIDIVSVRPVGRDAYLTMLEGNCIGMHATVLYRRQAVIEVGGFDASFRACEDYELYLRIAKTHRIVHGPEILADYRQHGNNMSGDRVMMLATVMRVLATQESLVAGNPAREAARERGRARWRGFYIRGQLSKLLVALTGRRPLWPALCGALYFISKMPIITSREAVLELLRRLKGLLPTGKVDIGKLRERTPVSRNFGYDRGNPVDRAYIERFLSRHADMIKGRVLEVGDNAYTLKFGGMQVTRSEVLHIDPDAPNVTYCTDLTTGEGVPDAAFDCIVLTQTLHLLYDFRQAVATLDRILKPGGVLLLTVPGVSSIDRGEWGENWLWSFTPASLKRLMTEQFGEGAVEIESNGNVLTATAFLYGLAESDLAPDDYGYDDPQYPVIVTAYVVKNDAATAGA